MAYMTIPIAATDMARASNRLASRSATPSATALFPHALAEDRWPAPASGDRETVARALVPWRIVGTRVVDAGIVARRAADVEATIRRVVQLPETRTLHHMN